MRARVTVTVTVRAKSSIKQELVCWVQEAGTKSLSRFEIPRSIILLLFIPG